MAMEVVGRHALLFDDDAMAAFVNSQEALVHWNSLLIDRYDVRHLLHSLPKRRTGTAPTSDHDGDGVSLSNLDHERFQDLPPDETYEDFSSQETVEAVGSATGGTYQAVAFSYGNACASGSPKNADPGLESSGFHPPFPVPESLVNNLPPTEKVHHIIARTAQFVSEHGGQTEFILRVKQGDNPTFGFLMPDHHLHVYFRFLVEHQEFLKVETDTKHPEAEKKVDGGQNHEGVVADGALSLLGSVYGSGEDEDGAHQVASEPNEMQPSNSGDVVNMAFSRGSNQAVSCTSSAGEDEAAVKHLSTTTTQKAISSQRDPCITVSVGTGRKKREAEPTGSIHSAVDVPLDCAISSMSKVEPFLLEPPSSMKQTIDKIVEFIVRNGKEFEAVLIQQNSTNTKFQFLLPLNPYHPYYLKVLQEAQESKLAGKSPASKKHDSRDKAASKGKIREVGKSKSEDISTSKESVEHVPNKVNQSNGAYISDRKEKFKMIIGGPKKDLQDPSSKPIQRQYGMSEDATAAIVLAATRGHRHPKSDTPPKTSFDDSGMGIGMGEDAISAIVLAATRGHRHLKSDTPPKTSFDDSGTGISMGEGARTSSIGSLPVSGHAHSSISKPVSNGEPGFSVPVRLSESVRQSDNEGDGNSNVLVAKAIAKTAALAAASEADSSEACLTREQKQKAERLKRAKMFAAMIKGGSHHESELLPGLSVKQSHSALSARESEGTTGACSREAVTALNVSGAEVVDLVAREREGSSAPVAVDGLDTKEKNDSQDDYDAERRTRKKHSSRSRRHEDDSEKEHKVSKKKHRSDRHSSHHEREDDRKYRKSHSRHRHKHHHNSSEDELRHKSRSDKHRKRSHAEKNATDVEEGEIIEKLENHSDTIGIEDNGEQDSSLDGGKDLSARSLPTVADDQPSTNATEVPDDLRAKIRAMLLATM